MGCVFHFVSNNNNKTYTHQMQIEHSMHSMLTLHFIKTITYTHTKTQQHRQTRCSSHISIAFKFGIIAMLSGIIGVPFGSYLVQRLRPRYTVKCDALVCAGGLLVSAPFVYASLVFASHSIHWCFLCMFVAEVSLNLCWSIVADMLLVRTRARDHYASFFVCWTKR